MCKTSHLKLDDILHLVKALGGNLTLINSSREAMSQSQESGLFKCKWANLDNGCSYKYYFHRRLPPLLNYIENR